MQVNLKLDSFEGPFDLLYHLIEKNEINIYDIPIAELTQQYLEYIELMQEAKLENISEFLVMAATLIEIKSKMLLPKQKEEEQTDPREELALKLEEYKKFKDLAKYLDELSDESTKVLFKEGNISIKQLSVSSQETDVESILNGISINDIFKAFENVVKRKENSVDKVRSSFNSIQKDLYTIEEKIDYLMDLLELFTEVEFMNIFRPDADKMEIVVTFLALLELIKEKRIIVFQHNIFENIVIKKNFDYSSSNNA